MADIVGYFPATSAVDGQSGARLRYAEAFVYAWEDTNYLYPLVITDLNGVAMEGKKLIANDGVYPDFCPPAGVLQVRARSGQYVTPMTSLTVYAQAAQDSANRADRAAMQVSLDADETERARGEAVAAALRAEKAAGNTILLPEPGWSGYYMFGA